MHVLVSSRVAVVLVYRKPILQHVASRRYADIHNIFTNSQVGIPKSRSREARCSTHIPRFAFAAAVTRVVLEFD